MVANAESDFSSGSKLSAAIWFDLLWGLLPLLMLAPMLAVEFQGLWLRQGMRYFPIPILVVGCLAAWNFRSSRTDQPARVIAARCLFLASFIVFGFSFWRSSPWLAHSSLVLLFASWTIERLDSVSWPRLLGWATLLATSMRLPGEWNSQLQSWLLSQSTSTTGIILDGLGVPFLLQANTFTMRGMEFSITKVFDGPYSIHALACVTVLLLLLTHRSLLVAVLTMLTLPLWAIIQNIVLQLVVVILKFNGERDASQGADHALLALGAFLFAVICIWISSWFLSRMLQPVPSADSEFEPEFLLLNSILCWPLPDPFFEDRAPTDRAPEIEAERRRIWQQASHYLQRASFAGVFGMLVCGAIVTQRWAYGNYNSALPRLPNVNGEKLASIEWKECFPEIFGQWKLNKVTPQLERDGSSEPASIEWLFGWNGQVVRLSVTFPLNTRQRLASKYEEQGWRVVSEQVKQFGPSTGSAKIESGGTQSKPNDSDAKQFWTQLNIVTELGGRAYAIVTYHPLGEFEPLEYQVVAFCESGEELTKEQLNDLYVGFHAANAKLRSEVEPRLRELLESTNDKR